MPALCSLAAIPNHERRNHVAMLVADLEAWTACTLVLAYDAEELPYSVQQESHTCLRWSVRRTHVAQQFPVAMLPSLQSLDRYLKINQPQSDHRTQTLRNPRLINGSSETTPATGLPDARCWGLSVSSLHFRNADKKCFSTRHAKTV